jgi:hypothetical protein
VILQLALAALLLGHGLIHVSFLVPRPPATAGAPPWPFALDRSWILDTFGVDVAIARSFGLAAIAFTIAAWVLSALITVGVGPADMWPVAIGVGTVSSLLTLLVFFHPWLVVGVGIDLGLLWTVFVLGWTPSYLA